MGITVSKAEQMGGGNRGQSRWGLKAEVFLVGRMAAFRRWKDILSVEVPSFS